MIGTTTSDAQNKAGLMPKQSLKEASKKAKRARYDLATKASVPELQANLEASNSGRATAEAPHKNGQSPGTKHARGAPAAGKGVKGATQPGQKRAKPAEALIPSVEQSLSFGVLKAKTSGVKQGTDVSVGGVPMRLEPTVPGIPSGGLPMKPRKVSLKGLLAKAEANQSRLDELKGHFVSVETGQTLPDEAWESSLKRAAGEKVRDDPALLRKSIRKEKQKKARSAKKWCVAKLCLMLK